MVQNQIRSLFLLFAGEEELPDAVQPVLDEAVLEVQQALKDGADEDDARLNWAGGSGGVSPVHGDHRRQRSGSLHLCRNDRTEHRRCPEAGVCRLAGTGIPPAMPVAAGR